MTKIDIISGFLGAGKTTLIKKLLADAYRGEQVVLIENEFGEIGIDGGFLKEAGVEIREMNSGCICCSLVGDFGAALKEVVEKYHPDRIVIEPSGVGKLSDVIRAVEGVQEQCGIELNTHTTVADVKKCKMYLRNFGEFFSNQIEFAGTIVLSRTDVATEDKVKQAVELIRQINPKANIITTPVENLGGKKVLEVMENEKADLERELLKAQKEHDHHHDHDGECCGHGHHHDGECCGHGRHHEGECCGHEHHHHGGECGDHEGHEHHGHADHEGQGHHSHGDHEGHGHHGYADHEGHHHDHEGHHHHEEHHHHHGHHHADEVFTSWGHETAHKYTHTELSAILDKLSAEENGFGIVLRAKGMVEDPDGTWHYFDMVPGECEIRGGAPEFTGRICVIGSQLKEDRLAELFGL